jgi:hypothetical protein
MLQARLANLTLILLHLLGAARSSRDPQCEVSGQCPPSTEGTGGDDLEGIPDLSGGLLPAAENATEPRIRWGPPEHCLSGACVFVDPGMAGGMMALTTADNAEIMADFPVLPRPRSPFPPFTEAEIPGKGRGMVANRTIKRGELIMVNLPTVTIQLGPPFGEQPEEWRIPLYEVAVAKLPEQAQEAFMSQYGKDINTKIDMNCFRMVFHDDEDNSGDHLGCFPSGARFNHDCRAK